MPRTIIHIGMPRAASTFFQQRVFPFVEDYTFIGVNETQYSDAFQRLLYQDDTRYDSKEMYQAMDSHKGKNLFLSNELFCGQSLYLAGTNRSRTARRLAAVFPDAEILIVLRNQVDLLQSLYSMGVYSGHTMSPEAFVRFSNAPSGSEDPLYPTFYPAEPTEIYFYSDLIKLYKGLFKKVHLVLYEDFSVDPGSFTSELLKELDITLTKELHFSEKVNRSLSARQLYFLKILNRWKPLINRGQLGKGLFRMKLRFIEKRMGGGKGFAFDSALRDKIQITFEADNLTLRGLVPEISGNENFKAHYLS